MKARATTSALLALALSGCPAPTPVGFVEPPPDGVVIVDPVDRASCPKTPATVASVFEERTYYFCSPVTAAKFRESPARHADR